ncbi:MAG: hypothetical protein B6D77_17945 [gamma proteobacterium symbiont of Ctena orbiculata]|nr:MAG: hypothetical protein B6D77_17945 [gamma proteobacterium symbiont of Ctena orbiculata]
MGQDRDHGLTSRGRFVIALIAAIALHGIVLMFLTGMRMSEPREPRILVGMMIKVPGPKPAEPVTPEPPPPAPKKAPPEPQAEKPKVAEPRQPKPVIRSRRTVTNKPVSKEKPIKKAHPQQAATPATQTTSVNTTRTVTSPLADTSPANEALPPRFHADYLHNPQPRYPLMSRKRREEGEVQLRVKVDAQGHPEAVKIHSSSGHSRLDRAATSTVEAWRFVPARKGGLNVAAWVIVPIQFNLEK